MTDLNALIENVYDYFQKKYGLDTGSLGAGSLFFAFEKLPISIAATDFKLNPADSSFNTAIAIQHGSNLVNFVAGIGSDGFIDLRGDLSPAVDEQYNLLLNSANPLSPTEGTAAQFLQIQGQALQKFTNSKANMNLTDFWPANFTPQFWFNDQDPTIWTSYAYSTGESTESGNPVKIPPQVHLGEWRWRVLTPEVTPDWETLVHFRSTPAAKLVNVKFRDPDLIDLSSRILTAPLDPMIPIGMKAHQIDLMTGVSTKVVDKYTTTVTTQSPELPQIELQRAQTNNLQFMTNAFTHLVAVLPEKTVTSSQFSLSFDYCLVNVDRPWLSASFLMALNWFTPGSRSGDLAPGMYAPGARPFAFLPAKFLVIKNLRISAQWSAEDRALLQNSASLGPFSLITKSFEQETLVCPGMQIIAWFCQIMPVLPPGTDPTLTG